MAYIKNSSFLFGDINRTSQHAARYKKQIKRKVRTTHERRFLRAKLMYGWRNYDVIEWADAYTALNSERLAGQRTAKKFCLYSHRVRSVNNWLGMSKYRVAHYTRLGLIKDLKRYQIVIFTWFLATAPFL